MEHKNIKKSVIKWAYRIFCFTIIQCLIATVGFVTLHYILILFMNKLTWQLYIILTSVALAICYLQVSNFLYWLANVNLLDFKKLWNNQNEIHNHES